MGQQASKANWGGLTIERAHLPKEAQVFWNSLLRPFSLLFMWYFLCNVQVWKPCFRVFEHTCETWKCRNTTKSYKTKATWEDSLAVAAMGHQVLIRQQICTPFWSSREKHLLKNWPRRIIGNLLSNTIQTRMWIIPQPLKRCLLLFIPSSLRPINYPRNFQASHCSKFFFCPFLCPLFSSNKSQTRTPSYLINKKDKYMINLESPESVYLTSLAGTPQL